MAEAADVRRIGALFDAHAPLLLRLVERLTGPGAHVEDVVQDVFLAAHRRRHELPTDDTARAWLCRTAINLSKHHRRGVARRLSMEERLNSQPPPPDSEAPDAVLTRQQQALRIRLCMAGLREKQRQVFVLHQLEGLEGVEIAAILGVPENTVWSRLHHACKRFRTLWDKQQRSDGGHDEAAIAQ